MTSPTVTVDPAAGDATGAVLLGRYELRERIGRGDADPVWRAHDLLLRRDVALRLLRTAADREPARARERAHLESRAAARFQHPSLAAIYDIAELDGDVVLVTELLRGPSLDRVLAARGRLSPPHVARIGLHLAGGLAVAHAHGVVHRDVEPGKVLLGVTGAGEPDGTAALADLGIASLDTETASARRAPEVACGAPASPAGDLWALGATLRAALEGHPPPGPDGEGPLGSLLDALLAPDPASRPDAHRTRAAFEAIVDALDAADGSCDHEPHGAARTTPVPAAPGSTGPPTRTWRRPGHRPASRRRRLVGASVVGATGLLAAGVVGVVATSTSTGAPTAAPEPPVLPAPEPAVDPPITPADPPITPADPGPAIAAVPLDGDPVLAAATADATRDRDRDRGGTDRDDRSERTRDRDDASGPDASDRGRGSSDRGRDDSDRGSDRGRDSDRDRGSDRGRGSDRERGDDDDDDRRGRSDRDGSSERDDD